MIDPKFKRALGQMIRGVQVVAAVHDGLVRAYCSHWISQVSFDEPIETFERKEMFDHELFFARVTDYGYGGLKEPPLLYSAATGGASPASGPASPASRSAIGS